MTDYNTAPDRSTKLRRSDDQRIFAGVCGGLGEHFGINAWWFRWAFIILTFFGFAGIFIYIAAWLLIPDAASTESIAAGWFDDLDMSDAGTLFGVLLIGVAALIIATSVFHISGAIVVAVVLGVGGYLLYRGDIRPPTPKPPSNDLDVVEVIETGDSTEVVEVEIASVAADDAEVMAVTSAAAATSVATKPPKPSKPPKEKKPRPPRSMLGRLTMAFGLIAISVMAIIEVAGWAHFQPVEYFGVALATISIGLLVGAWIGRAYWLIIIAILLAPWLFFSALLPNASSWAIGDPYYEPQTVDQVKQEYSLSFGQLTIDLTGLTEQQLSEVNEIKASVGLGQLDVRVPLGVGVIVNAEVGAGSIGTFVNFIEVYEVPPTEVQDAIEQCLSLPDGEAVSRCLEFYQPPSTDQVRIDDNLGSVYLDDEGIGLKRSLKLGTPPIVLELDLNVGAGEITVQQNGEQVVYDGYEG